MPETNVAAETGSAEPAVPGSGMVEESMVEEGMVEESLVEEVSIDGMCGVY